MKQTRTGWRAWIASVAPRRQDLRADLLAGLPVAISGVPDGMASSLLAGVPPIHGLYASFAGPVAGGLSSSTRLMTITTTSAAALAAGSVLDGGPDSKRGDAVIWLTLVAGAVMIAAGLVGAARYVRFVSYSVMLGFLTGVAVNIMLGQLPNLTGAPPQGNFAVTKALNVLLHPSEINPASLACGVGALAVLALLGRGKLAVLGSLVALVVPTVVVLLTGTDSVRTVSDVGAIPSGFPMPVLPSFSALSPSVIAGAASVAVIVLVQGAGVAEAAPNPDGTRSVPRKDFLAQGIGNLAAGAFSGQPVGGSVGQTTVNVTSGARSRWGAIFAGLWMLAVLVAFSGLVGKVVMPTLAAVLMFAAFRAIRPAEISSVLHAGYSSAAVMTTTFVSVLLLPVAAAVGVGLIASLVLQLNQEAVDLRVVRLFRTPDGHLKEEPAPRALADDDVLVLDVYGSLFYAGARTLQRHLPDPAGSHGTSVILRLRGRTTLGSTFLNVVGDYARRLAETGGSLYLSGLDPRIVSRWESHAVPETVGNVHLYEATDVLGESTREALEHAQSHRVTPLPPPADGDDPDRQ